MTYFKMPNALLSSKVLYLHEMFFFKFGDHGHNFENSTDISNKGRDYGLVKKKVYFSSKMDYRNATWFFLSGQRCHLMLNLHQGALPSANAESVSFGAIKLDQV